MRAATARGTSNASCVGHERRQNDQRLATSRSIATAGPTSVAGAQSGREEKFWTISHVAGGADGEAYVTIRSVIQDGERYAGVEVRPSTETTTKLRFERSATGSPRGRRERGPIVDCMDILCRHAEELAPSVVCSVLAVDSGGKLRPLASPSLPAYYSDAIDGIEIGPTVGSCGTAALPGRSLSPSQTSPPTRCGPSYRSHAAGAGPQGMLVEPDVSRSGRVIGTFGFYFHATRGPTQLERRIVTTRARLRRRPRAPRDPVSHRGDGLPRYADAARQPAGFPGRALLRRLRKRPESGLAIAVHCIDLEDFKAVNDTPWSSGRRQAAAGRASTPAHQ